MDRDLFNEINLNNMSLNKVLFIFYLLMMTTSNKLISKQMRDYINDNRYIQHILGFLTLIVLITLIGGIEIRSAIIYALIGYVWFIFSTKLDIHWNIIIIILLFVGYIFENNINLQEQNIKTDNNLTNELKEQLIKDNITKKTLLFGSVILVTIFGTLLYSKKKHVQYGGGYDIFTYMLNS